MTTNVADPPEWSGPSDDPADHEFGDVIEPASRADADAYDVVLVGEPYDGAVLGREGAREGPAAIRSALAATTTHHFVDGSIAGDEGENPGCAIGDVGDVVIPETESGAVRRAGESRRRGRSTGVSVAQAAIRGVAADVHESDALPIFLGGDNSLTYPNAAPLLDNATLGAISFDAHLDCRQLPESGPTSGTPYRQLHDAGLDAFAVVGARHFETSTSYAEYVDERGGEVVTAEAVGRDPNGAVDRALGAMDDVDAVYVSVDLDVLDAPAAPGVSAPTPGGLSTRELFGMLRHVAGDDRVAGFEVVECAPPLDTGDRTAVAGARAIAHFLSGYAGSA